MPYPVYELLGATPFAEKYNDAKYDVITERYQRSSSLKIY
jgi:hypothetical protein